MEINESNETGAQCGTSNSDEEDVQLEANNCHDVAVHQSAQAVLTNILDMGEVRSLKIVPGGHTLSFAQIVGEPKVAFGTKEGLENIITMRLAGGLAENILSGAGSTHAPPVPDAYRLAEMSATMQVSDWRQRQPDLADDIVMHCQARATELVTAHKDRILKVAEALLAKGTISGAEFAAIN
jgi:ATP-dependent Zn protease